MDMSQTYEEDPACQYADRYVAYLDILGYKAYISRAQSNGNELEAIRTLHDALKPLIPPRGANPMGDALIVRMFSDSIYIRVVPDPKQLEHALGWSPMWELANIAYRLAKKVGLFVRGALVFGKHYDDDIVLFSPALVKAVELEQKCCFYPRILVPQKLQDWADGPDVSVQLPDGKHTAPFLLQDRDDEFFLNYLVVDLVLREKNSSTADEWLGEHRDNIARHIDQNRNNTRVALKYNWLRNYHNRYCGDYLPPEVGEPFLIPDA